MTDNIEQSALKIINYTGAKGADISVIKTYIREAFPSSKAALKAWFEDNTMSKEDVEKNLKYVAERISNSLGKPFTADDLRKMLDSLDFHGVRWTSSVSNFEGKEGLFVKQSPPITGAGEVDNLAAHTIQVKISECHEHGAQDCRSCPNWAECAGNFTGFIVEVVRGAIASAVAVERERSERLREETLLECCRECSHNTMLAMHSAFNGCSGCGTWKLLEAITLNARGK